MSTGSEPNAATGGAAHPPQKKQPAPNSSSSEANAAMGGAAQPAKTSQQAANSGSSGGGSNFAKAAAAAAAAKKKQPAANSSSSPKHGGVAVLAQPPFELAEGVYKHMKADYKMLMGLPYEHGGSCAVAQAVAFHDVQVLPSMTYTCDMEHPPLLLQVLHLIKFSGDRVGVIMAVKDWVLGVCSGGWVVAGVCVCVCVCMCVCVCV